MRQYSNSDEGPARKARAVAFEAATAKLPAVASFTSRLLSWYRRHRRPLPWRDSPAPYPVWVSELMLQQTQVTTMLPYYARFMERFPSVAALAAASEEEVLAVWSGLGYYRRAKALHRAARIVVEERRGRLPEDVEDWLTLPGVGRYTAGAIVSIALGKRAPIVDGNVARVLARFRGVTGDISRAATSRELWRLAEQMLPRRAVGEFNQALMELGALVCTKTSPRCLVCPLEPECVARREGKTAVLPDTGAKPARIDVTLGAAVVERNGRVLLFQRRDTELMKGLWELPTWECGLHEDPGGVLAREARARYGIELQAAGERGIVKHSIMNRRIRLHTYDALLLSAVPRPHRWAREDEIASIPVSSMVPKILAAGRGAGERRGPRPGRVAQPATPELS